MTKLTLSPFFSLVLICILFATVCTGSDLVEVKKDARLVNDNIITVANDTITFNIQNNSLSEVIQTVISKSGIAFETPNDLLNDTINFQLRATDWPIALKKLLKGYNYAYSWKKEKLVKVFIFEQGTGKSMDLREPPPIPKSLSDNSKLLQPGNGQNVPEGELLIEDIQKEIELLGTPDMEFDDNIKKELDEADIADLDDEKMSNEDINELTKEVPPIPPEILKK